MTHDEAHIGVAGDFVGFKLFNDGVPYIVEQVANGVITITGWAGASVGPSGISHISAPFEGWIAEMASQ